MLALSPDALARCVFDFLRDLSAITLSCWINLTRDTPLAFLKDLSAIMLSFSMKFDHRRPPSSVPGGTGAERQIADVDDFYNACGLACRSRMMFLFTL